MRITQKTLARYQEIEDLLKELSAEKAALRAVMLEHGGGQIGDYIISISETTSERLVGKEQVAEVLGGLEELRKLKLLQTVTMTSVRVTQKIKKSA